MFQGSLPHLQLLARLLAPFSLTLPALPTKRPHPTFKMRSLNALFTFMVMTMIVTLCTAAPHIKPSLDVSVNASGLVNTILSDIIPDNSTPNGTADPQTQNKCYDWDTSEKWKDVGGQDSDFVNQATYNLCQLIAIEAYKGWHAGNTVSDILVATCFVFPALISQIHANKRPLIDQALQGGPAGRPREGL